MPKIDWLNDVTIFIHAQLLLGFVLIGELNTWSGSSVG